MLTHDEARRCYDRLGRLLDWQGFDVAALRDVIDHGDFADAHAVLEFGCGTGWLAARLLAERLPPDATYLGLDVSARMVKLAGRRLAPWRDRARVVQTDGRMTLDVPSASRDRFVSTYVLDLLTTDDIDALLDEAHRVLRPGGLLCLASLTHGERGLSHGIERVWTAVHARWPKLVGGCRPIELADFVGARWEIRHRRRLTAFGVPSEVLIARRA